jgi:hypothetical protein
LKSIGSLGDRLIFWSTDETRTTTLEVPGSMQFLSQDGHLCDQRWLDGSHRLYQIDKKTSLRPLGGAVLAWRGQRMLVEAPGGGATLETTEGRLLERISTKVEEAQMAPPISSTTDRTAVYGARG